MELERVNTRDGSATLKVVGWDETFHSRHGAVKESEHVYLKNGILKAMDSFRTRPRIRLMEMGFGTGLNALLAAEAAMALTGTVMDYHAIDRDPLDTAKALSLDYPAHLGRSHLAALFRNLHEASWSQKHEIHPSFFLKKTRSSLMDHSPEEKFDAVLYDAFGPRVQPELWTEESFRHVRSWMKDGGFLVTYCAKGVVKRAMRAAGLSVEALPGPPGKREMVRAWNGSVS